MAEIHPMMAAAFAPYCPTKNRDRAVAAYAKTLDYPQSTTEVPVPQAACLLWAEDQDALRLVLEAGIGQVRSPLAIAVAMQLLDLLDGAAERQTWVQLATVDR